MQSSTFCINCENEFDTSTVSSGDFCSEECKAEYLAKADLNTLALEQSKNPDIVPSLDYLSNAVAASRIPKMSAGSPGGSLPPNAQAMTGMGAMIGTDILKLSGVSQDTISRVIKSVTSAASNTPEVTSDPGDTLPNGDADETPTSV